VSGDIERQSSKLTMSNGSNSCVLCGWAALLALKTSRQNIYRAQYDQRSDREESGLEIPNLHWLERMPQSPENLYLPSLKSSNELLLYSLSTSGWSRASRLCTGDMLPVISL